MATATPTAPPMNDDDDISPVMPLYLANDAYYPAASAPPDEPIYQSQQPSAPPPPPSWMGRIKRAIGQDLLRKSHPQNRPVRPTGRTNGCK